MADPKGILGGLAGKAEKALTSGRKKREREKEDEATRTLEEPMEESAETEVAPVRRPRRQDNYPWD